MGGVGGEAEQDRQVIASRGFELNLSVMRLNKRREREKLGGEEEEEDDEAERGKCRPAAVTFVLMGDASAAPFPSDFLRRRYEGLLLLARQRRFDQKKNKQKVVSSRVCAKNNNNNNNA